MNKLLFLFLLLTIFPKLHSQEVSKIQVYSTKMNKNINAIVVTPELITGVQYKSVYILPGYSGTPESTVKEDIPNLVSKSIKYRTIYIIVDPNKTWYVDSPINKEAQYLTFIGEELVKYIDWNYPTKKNKLFRGIMGWSMGGYGALNVGVTYSDVFGIVGSTCGALDFKTLGDNVYEGTGADKLLGPISTLDPKFLLSSKIDKMVTAKQFYILDCGINDIFVKQSQNFNKALNDKNIEHLYIESLGEHNRIYWMGALSNQLSLFENFFNDKEEI